MKRFLPGGKQLLACLTALSLLLGMLAVLPVAASPSVGGSIWDGSVAESFADGDGSITDPFQIATADQLAYLVSTADTEGKHFLLTADIRLNDNSTDDWTASAQSWFDYNSSKSFSGTLDGAGHTIFGLYYNGARHAGLFPRVNAGSTAVLKNLIVSGADLTCSGSNQGVSALIGYADGNCTIDHVIVRDAVVRGTNDATDVAGFAARGTATISVDNSAFYGKLEGGLLNNHGLLGDFWSATLSVNRTISCGAMICQHWNFSGSNNYATVPEVRANNLPNAQTVAEDDMKGEAAKTNMPDLDWLETWETVEGDFPRLRFATAEEPEEPDAPEVWDGSVADSFAGGAGSAEEPYQIETPAQLAYLLTSDAAGAGSHFVLTADIRLNDTTVLNWKDSAHKWYDTSTAKTFIGTFDGAGHTVSGLYYDGTGGSVKTGLFPATNGATICNLVLQDSYLRCTTTGTGNTYVGGLIGVASTATTLQQCGVDESVTVSNAATAGSRVGGLIGGGGGKITAENCYFAGQLEYSKETGVRFGAMAGDVWNTRTFSNCYAVGVIFNSYSGYTPSATASYNTVGESNGVPEAVSGVTVMTDDQMKGNAARDNMTAFDWLDVWTTSPDGYPRLRFGTTGDEPETAPWDGSAADAYAGGKGTETEPFEIANAAQLARLVSLDEDTQGKFYVLTEDVALNDTSDETWTNTAKSWYDSNAAKKFAGTFDGQGHTISGLYYNGGATVALFPTFVNGVTVRNLVIADASFTTSGSAAASLGAGGGGVTLERCFVETTVSLNAGKNAGGLAAYFGAAAGTKLENCAFTGSITVPDPLPASPDGRYGALLGNVWNSDSSNIDSVSIRHCFATVDGRRLRGHTHAFRNDSTGNYNTVAEGNEHSDKSITVLTKEQMTGAAAKDNMPQLSWSSVWVTTEGYPHLRFDGAESLPGEVWGGGVATHFAGGTGAKDAPYQIATADQLAFLITNGGSTAGKYYELTHDILLNDTTAEKWYEADTNRAWYTSIGTAAFAGTLEGNGHTVSGLYYNDTAPSGNFFLALFPRTNGATINNLGVDHAYLHLDTTAAQEVYVAAIVGQFSTSLSLTGCFVEEDVLIENDSSAKSFTGGLAAGGSANITIDSCYFVGTLKHSTESGARYGAMIGNAWNSSRSVINSYAVGTVFCSYNGASVTGAKNYGTEADETVPSVTVLDASLMRGEDAKTNMPQLDWVGTYFTSARYPKLKPVSSDGTPGAFWTGRIATNYAAGTGEQNDPYQIATGEQLAKLVFTDLKNSEGKYYVLTADILLNDTSSDGWQDSAIPWFTVSAAREGCFRGHLDGAYHIISGLYLNQRFTNSVVYAGLFPTACDGASIHRVGLTQSEIHARPASDNTNPNAEAYAAGFVGQCFIDDYDNPKTLLDLSECFADATVTIDAYFPGGLIGGAPSPFTADNCYFVGNLIRQSDRDGGIYGNSWTLLEGGVIRNCYVATDKANLLGGGRASVTNQSSPFEYEHNYSNAGGVPRAVTMISVLMMRGEIAKLNMIGFDFDNVWLALDNGTPVLRGFAERFDDPARFSNTTDPAKIKITFETNGGNEIEPMLGDPETPLHLPTPVREGYRFTGWYLYRELDLRFTIDYFPYFDQLLYAGWEAEGVVQDFENYPNSIYDVEADYELYRPGTAGFDANYVHNGLASMHRIGADAEPRDVLLLYEDMLTPGQEYNLTFWVSTDKSGSAAELSLVFEEFPDVFGTNAGVKRMTSLTGLQDKEWQQVSYRFVAQTPWVALRTTGGASLYFDDFMFIPTSAALQKVTVPKRQNRIEVTVPGTPGDTWEETVEDTGPSTTTSTVTNRRPVVTRTGGIPTYVVVLIIVGGVLLAAAIVTTVLLVLRKKKKQTPQA